MDGSRKLTVALGVIAAISTSIAIALALRPQAAPAPGLPGVPVATGRAQDDLVPSEPRAPGGMNAIAAKALEGGGPRTPTATLPAGAPRRAVVSFRVPVDAASPATAWTCIAAAGQGAVGHLDTGGTFDGAAEPTVAAACTGAGSATLEGFVRLSVAPQKSSAGETTCEATVSYSRSGAGEPSRREVRSERVPGQLPDNCAASLVALRPLFEKRLAEP